MAIKLLGETLDIHGGGLDLQFPHHENELAQSESYTGKDFARIWMHNGLLKMGTAKMAGSVGNVVNIVDLLKRHTPDTVRFLLLSTHYRSPIEYSEERLDEIAKAVENFRNFFEIAERITGNNFYTLAAPANPQEHAFLAHPKGQDVNPYPEVENLYAAFIRDMNEDFNTAGAIGRAFSLLNLLRSVARQAREFDDPALRATNDHRQFVHGVTVLREMLNILGLFWQPPAKKEKKELGGGDQLVAGLMQLLLDLRNNLRTEAKGAAKDNPLKKALFDQTDLIRKRLAELGVVLEDRPGGTTWRVG
jgi:cysteinyl-tRNA synthetase